MKRLPWAATLSLVVAVTLAATGLARAYRGADRFDHGQHARLFPSCTSCHAGVLTGGIPWPAAGSCITCHDGSVTRRVSWQPPVELPHTNLAFDHRRHANAFSARQHADADSAIACSACHVPEGKGWMQVSLAVTASCLSCHRIATAHLAAPDTACATCHVPLARASRLTHAEVARFPAPPSHDEPGFGLEGHGRLAGAIGGTGVAASCATCHARDFCLQCHVNAPETGSIMALEPDARATAIGVTLRAPESHGDAGFLQTHGRKIGRGAACATCHTQESCRTCHAESPPRSVTLLARAGPGRAAGAPVERRRPATHGADFTSAHAPFARAAGRTCTTCHTRTECLSCHLPSPGQARGYHPSDFLTRHPAAATARASNCADCHNSASFCANCHAQAGLRSTGPLRANYHDANPGFLFGPRKAGRQGLATCVTCHPERDCLTCHAAQGGRRFNPHGPGFDAERLRRQNPEMCTACHGAAIPASP